MPRFGFIDDCDQEEDAAQAPSSLAAVDTSTPSQLPQPFSGGGRSYRGFLDSSTRAALRQASASGAALDAIAPVSASSSSGASGRPLIPLLILGGVLLAALR